MNVSTELAKRIGFFSLFLFGIGDILGAGIYGLIGPIYKTLGPAAWLGFVMAFGVAIFSGWSYAEAGKRFQKAAGVAYVSMRAFNLPLLSYLAGAAILFSSITSIVGATQILTAYISDLTPFIPPLILKFGLALFVSYIVFSGVRESLAVNAISTLIEVFGLLLIIFWGYNSIDFTYILSPIVNSWNSLTTDDLVLKSQEFSFSGIGLTTSAALAFYAFVGFEDLLSLSEETKKAEKILPKVIITSLILALIFYVLVSMIVVSTLTHEQLMNSSQLLLDTVRTLAPGFPPGLFRVIAIFAVFNTILLNFMMASRIIYGMSRTGLLPKYMGVLNHQTKTPARSIVLVFLLILTMLLFSNTSFFIKITSLLLMFSFFVMNISIMKVLKSEKKWFIGSTFGALTCLWMILRAEWLDIAFAGGVIIVFTALFFILKPKEDSIIRLET